MFIASVGGLYLSFYANVASGAAVVLVATVLFVLAFLFAPARGVVWPRNLGVSRQEINMLISRCRRDLVDAGLPGARLLERAPGGGGTRLALAPGAAVVMT